MVRVYDSDDLKKYIAQGEKVFEAGNKKMEVAFKVYDALGPSKASTLTPSMYEGMVAGALSEVAVIALAIVFCTTIIAVCIILSGRKGRTTFNTRNGKWEVEID